MEGAIIPIIRNARYFIELLGSIAQFRFFPSFEQPISLVLAQPLSIYKIALFEG